MIERTAAWRPPAEPETGTPARDDGMSNAKLGGRFNPGPLGAGNRRTRRAGRQVLVNNIAIVGAFLFVSAVVLSFIG